MNDWSIDIDEIESEYNYAKRQAKEWKDKAQDAKAEAYDDMADRLLDLLLDNGWEEYREEEARGIREGIDEDEAIEREWFDRRDGR